MNIVCCLFFWIHKGAEYVCLSLPDMTNPYAEASKILVTIKPSLCHLPWYLPLEDTTPMIFCSNPLLF